MLTTAQRIDILKIAADLAKVTPLEPLAENPTVCALTLDIYRSLKTEVDDTSVLDDTNMSDVKAAVDVASSLDVLIE